MTGSDELTADELAYLESGGKTELSVEPSPEPQIEPVAGEQGSPGTEPPANSEAAPGASDGLETDGDDDGDSLPEGVSIRIGKDGRPRLVGADGKFVKSVPHSALHKEREKHKLTKTERDTLKLQLARGEERLAILNEAFAGGTKPNGQAQQQQQQQQANNPLEEPDVNPEEDIFGAFKQMQRRTAYLMQQQSGFTQAQTARDAFSHVTHTYHEDARRMMQENPNFVPAYQHLIASRDRELQLMGFSDENERKNALMREEAEIVIEALKASKSPAQIIYDLAVTRGFNPSGAPAPNGNGGTPPASQHKTPAQQKIAQVRAGQDAAATLSNTGGTSHEGLTMAALANMSDDEFARTVDKMSKQQLEQFLGR